MKVALAFFGQPRFVDNQDIINTYKRVILDRYDTDVFGHMWWKKMLKSMTTLLGLK